eukprot:1589485-Amphidinium_carterae.1
MARHPRQQPRAKLRQSVTISRGPTLFCIATTAAIISPSSAVSSGPSVVSTRPQAYATSWPRAS